MMTKTPPTEGQQVQVKLYDGQWQDATYRDGGYIDGFGLPLDPTRVSQWRASIAGGPRPPRTNDDAARRFAAALS